MKNKKMNSKGITLIALIITIIVMLILVGVTVNIALNGELFENAKQARTDTEKNAILEELVEMATWTKDGKVNINELMSAVEAKYGESNASYNPENGKLTIIGKYGEYDYKVTETEIKIMDTLKQLTLFEKYILGETGEGRSLDDIVLNVEAQPIYMTFINEASTVPDASTSVKCLGICVREAYIKYEGRMYIVEFDPLTMETKTCKLVYEPTGREGEDLGEVTGNSEYTGWTIIYDNGTSVEAVSPEVMRKEDTNGLILGPNDSTVDWTKSEVIAEANIDGEEGLTDIEKAIYSYNHAIGTINTYCRELQNLPENDGVRSVGAREDKTTETYNEIPSDWENDVATKYNGKGKVRDREFEQDCIRMAYWGIYNINDQYWVASRLVIDYSDLPEYTDHVTFGLIRSFRDGYVGLGILWDVHSNENTDVGHNNYAVRPVITINNL